MAIPQTWTFDAPTGTYKNHFLSEDLLEAAIEDTQFMQFVRTVGGYGKKMGDTVTITRVKDTGVPTDGKIKEKERIPEDTITLNTVAVTVSEWGRSIPYTELSGTLSKFDMSSLVQQQLKNQLKRVMDNAAAAAFKTAKIKAIPSGATVVTFDTNGTPSTPATVVINTTHLELILDYLYDTLLAPALEGDDYVGIFANKSIRGIKDDPTWEEWFKYVNPDAKFNSEAGRWENLRLLRTNNATALSKTQGTGSVLGEGIIFGQDSVVMAAVLDPEMRMAQPEDFGRSHNVAWYGILEFLLLWDTGNAGEARVIHVTSS